MKRMCVLLTCVLWLSALFVAFAQSAAQLLPPKVHYDNTSRIKLDGVVENIEQRSLGGACKGPVVRKISRGEWSLEPRDDGGGANWLWMTAPRDSGKCT